MHTLENVCYNIRNVKSNYLKCIASRFLSPPKFVYYFSYQTSMAEEQKSQCDSPMLMHDLTQKGNHVPRISFHHREGGAAETLWKRVCYIAKKYSNFRRIIPFIIL